jgi:hypothetical protein
MEPQYLDHRNHTSFMSFDGADDEVLSPLAPEALGGRARMMTRFPAGDKHGDLLPKGRTCCILDQDISDETVQVSGIKGGEEFEFWIKATHLKMMPETDENTVGFACVVVKEDYCYPSAARNPRGEKLWIHPGDEGFIEKVDEPMWLAQVVIPGREDSYGNTVNGWFELDRLQVGTAKYGDVHVRFSIAMPPVNFTTLGVPTTSQFPMTKYFFDLFTGLLQESAMLGLFETFIDDMGDPLSRHHISHQLADGINRASLTSVFADPDFSIDDIDDYAVEVSTSMITSGGIYGRRYSRFRSASKYHKSKQNGIDVHIFYVGKAERFGRRMSKYNADPWNPKDPGYTGIHHTTIREARQRDMLVLLDLDPTLANFDRILTYAEQAMMCFLQSWRKKLVATEMDLPADTEASDTMKATAFLGLTKTDALIMHKISVAAARNNNLPDGVLRDGFGIHDGLYMQCPLLETKIYEKVLWVVLNAEDRWIYTRGLHQIAKQGFQLRYTNPSGETKIFVISFSTELQKELPTKTKIYPSWERMKNGVAHPAPYFRMPDVTAVEGADEINTLGFKITWCDQGQWKQKYLQAQQSAILSDTPTGRGQSGLTGVGFIVLNYFKQQIFLNKPAWMPSGQTARLLELKLDHLSQTVTADYVSKSITQVRAPRMKSIATLKAELEAYGLENVGEGPGFKIPPPPGVRDRKRYKCDNCYVADSGVQAQWMSEDIVDVRIVINTFIVNR